MSVLQTKGVPYRNEQQIQDITTEPIARLIIDPLAPFADDELQSSSRRDFDRLIKTQRKTAAILGVLDKSYTGWWESALKFLKRIPLETLATLSLDNESKERLKDVVRDTKARIEELLKMKPNLIKTLECFSDDQAVRILTIQKSKGLEFAIPEIKLGRLDVMRVIWNSDAIRK